MLIQDKNKHRIVADSFGFSIISVVGNYTRFIARNSIDTIIFSPNNNYEESAQWILYLNAPPKWEISEKASWLSRFFYFLKNKKLKKLRIRDDMNKDFYELPKAVEKYLKKVAVIDYDAAQYHRGELVSRKVQEKDDYVITKEFWKPKRTEGLPWSILYDRYNRTIEYIYKRDGAI